MNEVQGNDILRFRNLKDAGCDAEAGRKLFPTTAGRKNTQAAAAVGAAEELPAGNAHENRRKLDSLDCL